MKKATRGQVREHNRQLVLRSVYTGAATSRAALAQETGLTKPAISDLVEMLMAEKFLVEEGYGESTDIGGKRPRLLRFIPDARQVIGIALEPTAIIGVLTNLDGEVIATHTAELERENGKNDDLLQHVSGTINGLIAQAHAPLLCIGVGAAEGDAAIHMEAPLSERYRVPVHFANSSELTALAQYMFGDLGKLDQLVTLVIGERVGFGAVLKGAAHHLGGDIGHLVMDGKHDLDTLLGWQGVQARALHLGAKHQNGSITPESVTYLRMGWAAARGDHTALELLDELSGTVAHLCAWAITLMRPDHLSITGTISDLGGDFLTRVRAKTRVLTLPELVDHTTFSLDAAHNLAALGAAARAIQMEVGLA